MKKYFLKDQKYTKFTIRIFIVISVIVLIIGYILGVEANPSVPFFSGLLCGISFVAVVWVIYVVIRWILKAIPDDS